MSQLRQIATAFRLLRENNPRAIAVLAAVSLGVLAVFIVLGVLVGPLALWLPLGVMSALLAAVIIFGRSFQRFQISQIEGQPGAAAAVLQNMRGSWEVKPAVAFNRREDMVHLAVGRPGVVLVAEGSSSARLKQLLAKESRRYERAAGDLPVHTVIIGEKEGEVALGDLGVHVTKLGVVMKAKEVGPVFTKLDALGATQPPMPKGPQMRRAPKKYR